MIDYPERSMYPEVSRTPPSPDSVTWDRYGDARTTRFLRRAFLLVAAGTCGGAVLELAMLRHWDGLDQLVPWVVLAALAVGIAAVALKPTPRVLLAARLLAVGSAFAGAFGVWEHVSSNWETAPLSATWASTWDTLSPLQQWWEAATGGAGIAPPLAPGFLALTGICLALATTGLLHRR